MCQVAGAFTLGFNSPQLIYDSLHLVIRSSPLSLCSWEDEANKTERQKDRQTNKQTNKGPF